MLRTDVPAAHIVKPRVVAVCYHGVDRTQGLPDGWVVLEENIEESLRDRWNRKGVGECDGGLELPKLLDLNEAGRLTEPINDMACGDHFLTKGIALVRKDDRDAGLNRRIRVIRDGAVPNRHPLDIRDRVLGSGWQCADLDAESSC